MPLSFAATFGQRHGNGWFQRNLPRILLFAVAYQRQRWTTFSSCGCRAMDSRAIICRVWQQQRAGSQRQRQRCATKIVHGILQVSAL